MKLIEVVRLTLKCMEMVEGTRLEWWACLRWVGTQNPLKIIADNTAEKQLLYIMGTSGLQQQNSSIEVAVGVINSKPIWKGDEYYDSKGLVWRAMDNNKLYTKEYWADCSWNPPLPKTGMVELPISHIISYSEHYKEMPILAEACKKTLKGLK